jgi:hypothetical protein
METISKGKEFEKVGARGSIIEDESSQNDLDIWEGNRSLVLIYLR